MNTIDQFDRLANGHGLEGGGLKANTVRGGAFAMAAEGIDFVLRIGSVVILARLLAPEQFGLVAMVTAITSIAGRFKDFGLGSATIQSPEITRKQVSTLFWVNTALGLLLTASLAALAYPITLLYRDPRLLFITLVISTSFFWSGVASQHEALLRRTMKFGRIATIQIASSAMSIAVAVILAVKGFGYWALVGREVSRYLFRAVGAWTCFPWLPGAPSKPADVARMLRFGAEMTGSNLVFSISQSLDQVLIGKAFGAHQLGFYRQGLQLILVPMNQLAYPVGAITESALSRLQHDADRYRHYYCNILRALSLATIPLGLFLAVYAAEVVRVVLGERWIEATPIFRILAVGAFLQPAVSTSIGVMATCGQSRKVFWQGLLSSAALMIFFVAGIPFGPAGVASAHMWSLWLLLVPRLYWSFKDTPVTVGAFFSAISRPAVGGATMVAVLLIFKHFTALEREATRLAAGMAVALVAYAAGWLIMPRGWAELTAMLSDLSGPLGFSRLLPLRGR